MLLKLQAFENKPLKAEKGSDMQRIRLFILFYSRESR